MDQCPALADETLDALRNAGWNPGRAVDISGWEADLLTDGFPPLHIAARQFLAEYGGLSFADSGSGVTRAREAFALDPMLCAREADRFAAWGEETSRNIAPIGELAGDTCSACFLGIDESGEVLVVIGRLESFGRMPTAMNELVLGYMPRVV